MIRNKTPKTGPIVIDLTGPDGNAFVLLGYAKNFAKQLGFSKESTDALIKEMMYRICRLTANLAYRFIQ